jgi:hypothetical protein
MRGSCFYFSDKCGRNAIRGCLKILNPRSSKVAELVKLAQESLGGCFPQPKCFAPPVQVVLAAARTSPCFVCLFFTLCIYCIVLFYYSLSILMNRHNSCHIFFFKKIILQVLVSIVVILIFPADKPKCRIV